MTNGNDRERVLRKIRACFAHADEARNANENERATALRQANALMSKYAVELEELGHTDELGEVGQNDVRVGMVVWKQSAYFALGKLYGCKVLWNKRGTMYVIGRQHYRNVVEDMANYVVDNIEREAGNIGGNKTFLNSFRKGAVDAVDENVRAILAERAKAAADVGDGKALVLVDHFKTELQKSDEWMRNAHRVGVGRPRPGARDARGYAGGYAHGKGIGLNDQMGGGSRNKRLT